MVKAHAKINLALFITGKREDGYHELRSVFLKVGLFDTVLITNYYRPQITASWGPQGKKNIVSRVINGKPYLVYIHKKIPIGAGLGGGSADAAAVIRFLYNNSPKAHEVARSVGSDVPFFLTEKNAGVVRGRGEIIEPFSTKTPLHIVIYYPGMEFETVEGYRRLAQKRLYFNEIEAEERVKKIQGILESGNYDNLRGLLFNSFELIYREEFIREFKDLMFRNGAIGALLTGSGSAVFGIFDEFPYRLYRNYHDRFFFTTTLL